MSRIRPIQVADDGFWEEKRPGPRRKAVRYAVPVAVAGVAAATIGLVPALADTGDPDLPKVSAQELISKIAASDAQQLSGTVKITTDLGIPSLPSGLGQSASRGGKASASPENKLPELLSGTHRLRVAADGPDRQRVSILEQAAEYSLFHNGNELWAYDSASNSAYHADVPKDARAKGEHQRKAPKDLRGATPQELAKGVLDAAGDSTKISVDGTAKVAGRDAYQLVVRPKDDHSTVGAIRIAVDAHNGVPLKFTLEPRGGGKAVVDVGFSQVDFGKPKASTFTFSPPKGTKVTEGDQAEKRSRGAQAPDLSRLSGLSGLNVTGKDWGSVARIDMPGGAFGGGKSAAGGLLGGLGKKATGDFGSGTVIGTRLINALVTDDGKVFVGAVDTDALVAAADAAK